MEIERQNLDRPTWPSISLLEDELQAAICHATSDGGMDPALAQCDVYFAQAGDEDPTAYRRSILRLLGLLRPQLALVFGQPTTKQDSAIRSQEVNDTEGCS